MTQEETIKKELEAGLNINLEKINDDEHCYINVATGSTYDLSNIGTKLRVDFIVTYDDKKIYVYREGKIKKTLFRNDEIVEGI